MLMLKVVVGRDARISGPMIHNLVVNTLIGLGIDVIDLGLSDTTVEIAVPQLMEELSLRLHITQNNGMP
jgi:phosphomannomutase